VKAENKRVEEMSRNTSPQTGGRTEPVMKDGRWNNLATQPEN